MRIAAFAVALALSCLTAQRADACSCLAPGPPCEEMFYGTVFVGKALSATSDPMTTITTFEIVEVLNGTLLAKTLDVHSPTEGSACGVDFAIGTTYVVYTGNGPKYGASMCSRTHALRKNDEDVAFAHAAAKSKATKARIDGTVRVSKDPKDGAGADVRVKGTTIAVKSDASGKFNFELAPGTYELDVVKKGLSRRSSDQPMTLTVTTPKQCIRPVVSMSWDGQIQGRITYPDGKPAAGAKVAVVARPGTPSGWRFEDTVAADGSYAIKLLDAGSYSVVVSLAEDGYPSPASPQPTTYYPGTPDEKQAKVVTLVRAEHVPGIDFVVPPASAIVTITGDVTRADGSPVANAYFIVTPEGRIRSTGGSADDKGAFSIEELAGLTVKVRACAIGNLSKCSEVITKVAPGMKRLAIKLPK